MENRTDQLSTATLENQKTPEQIEREMIQTRESMTEKVTALESQVVGTVQTAADTLTGTVDAVKSLMETAPGAVSDTVKQAANAVGDKMKEVFDMSGHVRNNPWSSIGVSAGLGFLTGLIVFRNSGLATGAPPAPTSPTYVPAAVASAPAAPGLFDDLLAMLSQKVKDLAHTAIESASTAASQNVREGIPKLMDAAAEAAGTRLSGVGNR